MFAYRDKHTVQNTHTLGGGGRLMEPTWGQSFLCLEKCYSATSLYFPPCCLSLLCHVMNNIPLEERMDISYRMASWVQKEKKRKFEA